MFKKSNISPNKKKIILYVLILIIISYIFQLIIYFNGGIKSELFPALAIILMWFPAIMVFVMRFFFKESLKKIPWGLKNPLPLLFAYLIPTFISIITTILIILFKFGKFELFEITNNVVKIKVQTSLLLGTNDQHISIFIINVLLSLFVEGIITSIATFGEELGWRGFLQQKLIAEFGVFKGIIILGLIWGYWHMPIIFMGYNYKYYPILGGIILMPLFTICLSFIFAWLTIKANSLWPAVIAHSVFNSFYVLPYISFQSVNMPLTIKIDTINFILLILFAFLMAFLLKHNIKKRKS